MQVHRSKRHDLANLSKAGLQDRESLHDRLKIGAHQLEELHIGSPAVAERFYVGGALFRHSERHLAEEVAGGQAVNLIAVDEYLNRTRVDEVHAVANLSRLNHWLAGTHLDNLEHCRDLLQASGVDVVEDGQLADKQESAVATVELL